MGSQHADLNSFNQAIFASFSIPIHLKEVPPLVLRKCVLGVCLFLPHGLSKKSANAKQGKKSWYLPLNFKDKEAFTSDNCLGN